RAAPLAAARRRPSAVSGETMTRHHLFLCAGCLAAYRRTWPGMTSRDIRVARAKGRRCARCAARRVVALVPDFESSR
ncbi:MAG TPA: hypothetical protein VLL25_18560, partial [Acidimicrobiales bacterium]|nr:hypothetical protein [Acidimicrobiales bacterium]